MPAEQYPADWDDRRRRVYERDNYECQTPECDAKGGPKGDTELHAHHITPISQGGSHDYTNLVTLCRSCHNDQHAHDITRDGPAHPPLTTPAGTVKMWVAKNIIAPVALPFLFAVGALWLLQTGATYGIFGIVFGTILTCAIGLGVCTLFPSTTIAGYGIHAVLWGFFVFAEDGVVTDIWQFGLSHANNAVGAALFLPTLGIILTFPLWVLVFGLVTGWNTDVAESESRNSPPNETSTVDTNPTDADSPQDVPEEAVSWAGLTSETVENALYEHGIYTPADIIDVGESLRAIPSVETGDINTLVEFSTAALGAASRPDEPMTADRAVNWSDRPNVTEADEATLYDRGIFTIEDVIDTYDSINCIDGLSASAATVIKQFAVAFAELSDSHSVPDEVQQGTKKTGWRGLDTVYIED